MGSHCKLNLDRFITHANKKKNGIINGELKEQIKYQPQVLLVEDEPIVQKVHKRILEKLGCKVDLAINADQALEKARNDYDLIFMDVGLPGDKSGIDVVSEIRANELGRKDIPIVVLTGYTDEVIKDKCLAAKANEVYTKPIHMEKLNKILEQYVIEE